MFSLNNSQHYDKELNNVCHGVQKKFSNFKSYLDNFKSSTKDCDSI